MDAHSTLTVSERAALARMGCIVCIEYANGTARCMTQHGTRIYSIETLRRMAEPMPLGHRIKNWIAGVSA